MESDIPILIKSKEEGVITPNKIEIGEESLKGQKSGETLDEMFERLRQFSYKDIVLQLEKKKESDEKQILKILEWVNRPLVIKYPKSYKIENDDEYFLLVEETKRLEELSTSSIDLEWGLLGSITELGDLVESKGNEIMSYLTMCFNKVSEYARTKEVKEPIYRSKFFSKRVGKEIQKPSFREVVNEEKQLTNLVLLPIDSLIKYFGNDGSFVGWTLKDLIAWKTVKKISSHLQTDELKKMLGEEKEMTIEGFELPPKPLIFVYRLPVKDFRTSFSRIGVELIEDKFGVLNQPKLEEISIVIDKKDEGIGNNLSVNFVNPKVYHGKIQEDEIETKVKFPDFAGFFTDRIQFGIKPYYHQIYYKTPYDVELLTFFRLLLQQTLTIMNTRDLKDTFSEYSATKEEFENMFLMYKEFVEVAKKNEFGNGSPYGQFGRMISCNLVHQQMVENSKKKNYFNPTPKELYDFLGDFVYGYDDLIEIQDSDTMDFVELSEAVFKAGGMGLRINQHAHDGILFDKDLKGETAFSDLMIASFLMCELKPLTPYNRLDWMRQCISLINITDGVDLYKYYCDVFDGETRINHDLVKQFLVNNFDNIKNYDLELYKLVEEFNNFIPNEVYNEEFGKSPNVQDWLVRWRFLTVAQCKAKEEIFETGADSGDYNSWLQGKVFEGKKTRNYFAPNVSIFLPLMSLINYFLSDKLDVVDQDNYNTVHSLSGWDPTQGGIHLLITRIRKKFSSKSNWKEGELIDWFVFCDNLFVVIFSKGKIKWFSLDGSKMEASSDIKFAKLMVEALSFYFVDKISPELMTYLTQVVPTILCNMYAVMEEHIFKLDYLSSGSVGTSITNHIKMSTLMMLWLKEYSKDTIFSTDSTTDVFSKEFKECCNRTGIILKIERVQDDLLTNMMKNSYLDLDLLGYGAISHKLSIPGFPEFLNTRLFPDFAYPCLSVERLTKMILFMKVNVGKSATMSNVARNLIVRIIKLKLAYIYGGWLIDGLKQFLGFSIKLSIKKLKENMVFNQEKWLINEISLEEFLGPAVEIFGVQTLLNELSDDKVPSIMTIVNLTMSKNTFKHAMNYIMSNNVTKFMDLNIVSPVDIKRYAVAGSFDKYIENLVDIELKEAQVENIETFIQNFESLKEDRIFVWSKRRKPKIGDLIPVDILNRGYLGLMTSKDFTLTVSKTKLLLEIFNKVRFHNYKIKLDKEYFYLPKDIRSIGGLLYTLQCYYFSQVTGIPMNFLSKRIKEMVLTSFPIEILLGLLRQIRVTHISLYPELKKMPYQIIEDKEFQKYPEFILLYYKLLSNYFINKSDVHLKEFYKLDEKLHFLPYEILSIVSQPTEVIKLFKGTKFEIISNLKLKFLDFYNKKKNSLQLYAQLYKIFDTGINLPDLYYLYDKYAYTTVRSTFSPIFQYDTFGNHLKMSKEDFKELVNETQRAVIKPQIYDLSIEQKVLKDYGLGKVEYFLDDYGEIKYKETKKLTEIGDYYDWEPPSEELEIKSKSTILKTERAKVVKQKKNIYGKEKEKEEQEPIELEEETIPRELGSDEEETFIVEKDEKKQEISEKRKKRREQRLKEKTMKSIPLEQKQFLNKRDLKILALRSEQKQKQKTKDEKIKRQSEILEEKRNIIRHEETPKEKEKEEESIVQEEGETFK
jgi:hypothetical protein